MKIFLLLDILHDVEYSFRKQIVLEREDIFAFMSTLDMNRKGTYYFEFFVRAANKDIKFNFEHHLK